MIEDAILTRSVVVSQEEACDVTFRNSLAEADESPNGDKCSNSENSEGGAAQRLTKRKKWGSKRKDLRFCFGIICDQAASIARSVGVASRVVC
jgi:hypothetical protein